MAVHHSTPEEFNPSPNRRWMSQWRSLAALPTAVTAAVLTWTVPAVGTRCSC